MNVPAGAKIPLIIVGAGEETGIRVESQLQALLRMARLEDVSYGSDVPAGQWREARFQQKGKVT